VLSPKEVVENLALHLAEQQRVEFEKKQYFCKNLLFHLKYRAESSGTGKARANWFYNPPEAKADFQPRSLYGTVLLQKEILIEHWTDCPDVVAEVSVQVLSPKR